MQDDANLTIPTPKRAPWNKGKLIGAKPPLRQKHVWAIRTMLQVERSKRDLAMFCRPCVRSLDRRMTFHNPTC